jgi:nucleosome binding factor SPN SPT16 subunit
LDSFTISSSKDKLDDNGDAIYFNVTGKYADMLTMAGRTLLINPTDTQKEMYNMLFEIFTNLVENIKVGVPIKDVYNKTLAFAKEKNSELAS